MIIVLKPGAGDGEIEDVCRRIEALGLRAHVSRGEQRTVIGAIGDDRFKTRLQALEALECVESMVPIPQPYKLVSREVHPTARSSVEGVAIGGGRFCVMAGPCSVESREQILGRRRRASRRRRPPPARRRFQAAHLALRVPGAQGGGARAPRRGAQGDRDARHHRGDGRRDTRPGRRVRRHAADRRPQHAKLLAPRAGRRAAASRCCSSAGSRRRSRSGCLAAEYIVARRQPQGHPLRARHPHVRDHDPQHARPRRGAGAASSLTHLPIIVDPSHGTGHWRVRRAHGARRGSRAGPTGS